MSLTFDVETHTYRLDGRRLPSVTGAIRAAGFLDDLTWFGSAAALRRGRIVHALAAAVDDLGWTDPLRCPALPVGYTSAPREIVVLRADGRLAAACPSELVGYFRGYVAFRQMYRGRWSAVERPIARGDLGYAGTPDRIGILNGRPAVLEIKTGTASGWHGYQLAAYDMLDPLPFERLRVAVYLPGDGTYKLRTYADGNDRICFLRSLARVGVGSDD